MDEGRAACVSSRCPALAALLSPASGPPAAAGRETLAGCGPHRAGVSPKPLPSPHLCRGNWFLVPESLGTAALRNKC